jgi:hypothetical protein
MSVWYALVLPVLAIIALRFFFVKQMRLWEYVVPVGASFLMILMGKGCADMVAVQDTEY